MTVQHGNQAHRLAYNWWAQIVYRCGSDSNYSGI